MSMATGAGMNRMTPNLQKGKSKGGLTPFSMQQFTPEAMQLYQHLFSQLGPNSFINKLAGGDQGAFNELEAPALRQFGELQGNIASRFSGAGSGARHSSGFQNTMNQASSNFAQDLQSQRLGIRNQALRDMMGMSNQLLQQRPYEQFVAEKKPSFLKQMLAGIAGPALQGALMGGAYGYMNRNQSGGSPSDESDNDMINMLTKIIPFIV